MNGKNKVLMSKEESKKSNSLFSRGKRVSSLLVIAITICVFLIGAFLGGQWNAGTLSGGKLFIIGVAICIITTLIFCFFSRKTTRKIALHMDGAVKRLESLSRGDLYSDNDAKATIKEMDALNNAMESLSAHFSTLMADFEGALSRIMKHDLDFQMSGEYVGEFKKIQDITNNMLDFLNTIMHRIEDEAGHVQNVAGQISTSSQNLAQGATEQAGAVEELLSTVNDISGKVGQTANATSDASEKATTVRDQVTKSNEHMQNLTGAMNEINDYSKQVAKIVKIIEDIAFQTNILALNAAVEAARAGVNGRSFAVVADEVKSLATKSASAAADTTNLIRNTISAVEKGMDISTETADVLKSVVGSVDEMARIVSDISAATAQENVAIQQVVQGLDQVSVVVQSNSATAEEHAAVSHELAEHAGNLQHLVESFKQRRD